MTNETAPKLAYRLEQIAELSGHEDRIWSVEWNPTKRGLATCSADKTVRIYAYPASLASSSTSHFDYPDHHQQQQQQQKQQQKQKQQQQQEQQKNGGVRLLHSVATGHKRTVRALGWAPGGASLATASFDGEIGIWEQEEEEEEKEEKEDGDGDDRDDDAMRVDGINTNTNTSTADKMGDDKMRSAEWECVTTLEGHESECKSVAFSPAGTLLATCGRDKAVWIWEVYPDSEYAVQSVLLEHTQDVKKVAWHPTEDILASASYDDTIKLYHDDPDDEWYCFATLSGHASTVWSVAWAPEQSYLASASDDGTVRIWKRTEEFKWECVLVLGGHSRTVYALSWGRGGRPSGGGGGGDGGADAGKSLGWIASCDGDGNIMVWELEEPTLTSPVAPPTYKLIAHAEAAHGVYDINTISWNPKPGYEDILATGGDDCILRLWRVTRTSQ